jgi:hypothetical protein
MSILALWLKRGFAGGTSSPGTSFAKEVITRDGFFVVARNGAEVTGR